MTPEQEKALEATLGTVQRVAMRIAEVPRDRREEAFSIARRGYEDGIRKQGFDPAAPAPGAWLAKVMQGLRFLVAEIDSSGGVQPEKRH